ncbi:MAG TPA: hypothetical protein VGD66_10455 [Allosphingosinicella sp.]|jgi:hypothetical protein
MLLRFVAVMALALPAAAIAAKPAKQQDDSYRTKKICRVEQEIGSRLSSVTTCRTRAEDKEAKMEQRRVTERIQAFKPLTGE